MKLIKMTDYLPEHPYSKFLKQPLEKWMFDKDDERCLFKGFRYDGFKYLDFENYSFQISEIEKMTIEDLVKYNLQLTPTAQKQLGL